MSVRVYHTSDLHDHRGIVPRLRALRKERPGLLLDCGDSLRGSQSIYHRREPIIAEIDAAGYDAQAIGNREFHYLFGLLRARAARMQHPLLCSNLLDTKGRRLPFQSSLIVNDAGTRIHLLGLLIMQYPVGSWLERVFGWRFLDPWDAVEPYAQQVPDGEMLIVLSHVGLTLDRRLAERVPRIDLLLGGHSHDTTFAPEYVGRVPIVHAGPYGKYVSRTELASDGAGGRFAIENFELVPLLGAMTRVLLVSNGHGEIAIASRIALEIRKIAPAIACDHLALVGQGDAGTLVQVGPQRRMPSGGIIAMGNLGNIVRDIAGGLIGLTLAQRRFLKAARGTYAAAVAVGDVYALLMTLAVRTPAIFVGTAKSVLVAPYGALEERVLRRARAIFVRDRATAERLRSHGVAAEAPGNTIVDLFSDDDAPEAADLLAGFAPALAIFPGSRESAYSDARVVSSLLVDCGRTHPALGAALSIAPALDADIFARGLEADGWEIVRHSETLIPFSLRRDGRTYARAWSGPLGALFARVALVIGQAGTANEGAAAAGVPVAALGLGNDRKTAWYRMRQHGLLGDALAVLPGDRDGAARAVNRLLDDPRELARMGAIGRERMGAPGGTRAIAQRIVEVADGG